MAAGYSRPLSLIIFLVFSLSAAREILVGGKKDAWTIPSSSHSQSLNRWAESSGFRIGDTLVWNYDAEKESVLEVTEEDYATCNISNPIAEYKDGKPRSRAQEGMWHLLDLT